MPSIWKKWSPATKLLVPGKRDSSPSPGQESSQPTVSKTRSQDGRVSPGARDKGDHGRLPKNSSSGLHMLYDGTDSQMNIIAVPAFGGNNLQSFTHPSNGCCWLRDLLPTDLRASRILSYGYEPELLALQNVSIYDLAQNLCECLHHLLSSDWRKRPIVFIAHSLGGVLVKQALVLARTNDRFKNIVDQTAAVFFFGTPQRISSATDFRTTITKILQVDIGGSKPSRELSKALRSNLPAIQIPQFSDICNELRVVTFYEAIGQIRSGLVVNRSSAVLSTASETCLALNADHQNMCRYPHAQDANYEIVRYWLQQFSRNIEADPKSQSSKDESTIFRSQPGHTTFSWLPNVVSKSGITTMGLFEMGGSMEVPASFAHTDVDIVIVHGIGGSPYHSWINNDSKVLWPREFLQKDFASARVMCYGYRAEPALNDKVLDLSLLASDFLMNLFASRVDAKGGERQPIILMGYSFGGVVLKRAILLLSETFRSAVHQNLLNSLIQIIFLGVPHDFEDTSMARRWTDIVRCTTAAKNLDVFNTRETMKQIHHATRDFRRFNGLYAASVVESTTTKLPAVGQDSRREEILVPAELARLDWADHETIFVARGRNHLQLPTFIDDEDPTYIFIRDAIKKTLSRCSLGIESGEDDICMRILHRRHMSALIALDRRPPPYPGTCDWIFDLAEVKGWVHNPERPLFITGPTGCGKTVLAKHLLTQLPKRLESSTVLLCTFCGNSSSENLPNGLGSLIYQLCQHDTSLLRYATSAYRSLGDEFTGSRQALIEVLEGAIGGYRGKYLCIVLDVETEDSEFYAIFLNLLRLRSICLVLLGQRLPSFEELGEDFLKMRRDAAFVDWELDLPKSVIEKFIRSVISDSYPEASETDRYKLEEYALRTSGVSFLPARVITYTGIIDVEEQPTELPSHSLPEEKSLEEIYDDTLRRFKIRNSEVDFELLRDFLGNLLCSFATISVKWITEALIAYHPPPTALQGTSDPQTAEKRLRHRIIEPLRSLVQESLDGRLRFVHSTFESYLVSNDAPKNSEKPLSQIDITAAHLLMTKRCVAQIQKVFALSALKFNDADHHEKFTAYAATYWMKHYLVCQNQVGDDLEKSLYNLFDLGTGPSLMNRWLSVYKKITGEKLPQDLVFAPLFGGSYLGLSFIVRRSLATGADIEAQDGEGKTALHWACDRGFLSIVEILVAHGAQLDCLTFDGWTCVHFAARRGNADLVALLVKFGAEVDIPAADGYSPLNIAYRWSHFNVVEQLLGYGADPTHTPYSGLSLVQKANLNPTGVVLRMIMTSPAASKAVLARCIYDNNFDLLRLMFHWRSDLIIESFPWVGHLLQEELDPNEVLELLLKSENLDWMETEPWEIKPKKPWRQIRHFPHRKRCAHHLVFPEFIETANTPETWSAPATDINTGFPAELLTGLDDRSSVQSFPSTSTSTESSPRFGRPENYFDKLEHREQELVRFCGIAGCFPPAHGNTNRINPGFAQMRLNAAQIIYGPPPAVNSLPTLSSLGDIPALQYKRRAPGDASRADDRFSLYSSVSDFSQKSDGSYDSVQNDENFEIWDQRVAQHILEALENILNALEFLHSEGECCDRLTALIHSSQRVPNAVVEVKTITAEQIYRLCEEIEPLCRPSETKPSGWTKPLAELCESILTGVGYGMLASQYLKRTMGSGHTPSPTFCLHLSALIAQLASLSLVTYSRGHSREFYSSCITRPIDFFVLGGSEFYGPSICAERVNLDCMGKMLKRSVWMFHQNKQAIGTFKQQFYLSTSVENLLDTWGGSVSVMISEELASSRQIRISVGGGVIGSVESKGAPDLVVDNELFCHWSPQLDIKPLAGFDISKCSQLLIGATMVNPECPLRHQACQNVVASSLVNLGTRAPAWKTTSRSAGFSGGQWFTVNTSRSQTKDDGRNLKRVLIESYRARPDIRLLNSPWGLELSLCTGIARRVLLRHLIYGEVLSFLELGLPGEWRVIQSIAETISELDDSGFDKMLRDLTKYQTKVLKRATEILITAMEFTGVEDDGHTLRLWWPEKNAPIHRGIRFFKSQYSGRNPWIGMIKDSENCAVFGLATSRCLEHDDVKTCQKHEWIEKCAAIENIMLDTTLTPADSQLTLLQYSKDSKYQLWKRTDLLVVTKANTGGVVQLGYQPSVIQPPIILHKLRMLGKLEKVKERQGPNDFGQSVLVL